MFLSIRRKQSSHVRIIATTKKQALCQCRGRCGSGVMQLEGYTTGAFERGAPAWKEKLWVAVKCVFFQTPWPWPSALRVALHPGPDGAIEAIKHPREGAGVITSLTETDGLAELPEDTTQFEPGAMVDVQLLEGVT